VLGYGLWQRRYNSDPSIVGKTILLNSRPYTVVGRHGPRLPTFASESRVSTRDSSIDQLPNHIGDEERDSRHVRAVARLKPGVSVAQARADVMTDCPPFRTGAPDYKQKPERNSRLDN
jgi:putative ABC transport system permease protein